VLGLVAGAVGEPEIRHYDTLRLFQSSQSSNEMYRSRKVQKARKTHGASGRNACQRLDIFTPRDGPLGYGELPLLGF